MFEVVVCLYNTLFCVIIKHRAKWVILCEMCLSEMSVWMHIDPGRTCSVMRKCAIEQCLARWWSHLSSVGIARGLYLLRCSYCLNSERVLPRRLRVCRCDAELWADIMRGRAAWYAQQIWLILISWLMVSVR